jgi:hypothetical protein
MSIHDAFSRVERVVACPPEKVVSLPEPSYLMMSAVRTWKFSLRRLEDLRSTLVHLWALPSHRDIRLLSARVARLQRSVEEIEQRMGSEEGTWS